MAYSVSLTRTASSVPSATTCHSALMIVSKKISHRHLPPHLHQGIHAQMVRGACGHMFGHKGNCHGLASQSPRHELCLMRELWKPEGLNGRETCFFKRWWSPFCGLTRQLKEIMFRKTEIKNVMTLSEITEILWRNLYSCVNSSSSIT